MKPHIDDLPYHTISLGISTVDKQELLVFSLDFVDGFEIKREKLGDGSPAIWEMSDINEAYRLRDFLNYALPKSDT